MKRVIRAMQGTGFLLFMLGSAAFEAGEWTSICLITVGIGLLTGFLKLENSFYFEKKEKKDEEFKKV